MGSCRRPRHMCRTPEAADSARNWDYRACLLRDAFFVVHALNRLGATRTMEDFLGYITTVTALQPEADLRPVYGIVPDLPLDERVVTSLAGYRGMGPVRISFWYVDALSAIGRPEDARDLFVDLVSRRNPVGLLSEDIHPQTGELWGNFPQTYSMAGLVVSAMRLSKSWEEAFWRGS